MISDNCLGDFDINEEPKELLLDRYPKFPLYIEVLISENSNFLNIKKSLSPSNIHGISVLAQKKDDILLRLFPFALRIYLVPKLNVLTVEFRNRNFSTD